MAELETVDIDVQPEKTEAESHKKTVFLCFKRAFDIVSSLIASVILLVPITVVAILIMIKDPGCPFYIQERMGKGGKPLKILKFRTMRKGADKLENMLSPEQLEEYKREYKLNDDPRLIGYKRPGDGSKCFGARLRQLSIDELPQIPYNILLKGDMSVVGPRPILREELEKYYSLKEQQILLSVKPGLTGYWQAYARNGAKYQIGGGSATEYGAVLCEQNDTSVGYKDNNQDDKCSIAAQRCEINEQPKPVYEFFKRIFDIVVALVCLTVGLPVYIIIAVAIMIDDFGNPFFVQERIGYKGKPFLMVKFRTMFVHSEDMKKDLMEQNEYESVHFKIKNDPRITHVGKFLRKTSLDEITQAVNLLTGSMSVIGPRAFVKSEQEQLPNDRLCVKPGLSCYWQIADTANMTYDEQLELDYKYIRERGFATDLKIIFKTIATIVKGKNC